MNKSAKISVTEQCELLDLNRSSVYYEAEPLFSNEQLAILNQMDRIFTDKPFYGYRRVYLDLIEQGFIVGRDRVLKYMRVLGLETFYPRKRKTTIPGKGHKIYPYLLKGLNICRSKQVWATDITYIRLAKGFCYLVAVIDWYSRRILSYRISNSLDTAFCLDALQEAIDKFGVPEIFNSDQGCQFTSQDFTDLLKTYGIQISMDSKGRAIDNVIIERFFRSLKYENIYLREYPGMPELREGVFNYMNFYNYKRPHSSLANLTPAEVYEATKEVKETKQQNRKPVLQNAV
ncbi:MAG: IS3 family transposase [Candidatus Margulisiibacteriota bacterium]